MDALLLLTPLESHLALAALVVGTLGPGLWLQRRADRRREKEDAIRALGPRRNTNAR